MGGFVESERYKTKDHNSDSTAQRPIPGGQFYAEGAVVRLHHGIGKISHCSPALHYRYQSSVRSLSKVMAG